MTDSCPHAFWIDEAECARCAYVGRCRGCEQSIYAYDDDRWRIELGLVCVECRRADLEAWIKALSCEPVCQDCGEKALSGYVAGDRCERLAKRNGCVPETVCGGRLDPVGGITTRETREVYFGRI
jgi:hypothetical protein